MSRTARLGAFILGTLAILSLGIFIIGGKKYLFSSTYHLKTKFASVAGLETGADVLVGGVHSGIVSSIDLPHQSGNLVTVTMVMDNSTRDILKQDSVASIDTEGLLGNEYVAVSFGSAGKPAVQDGDVLSSIPPIEMSAILDKANGLLAQGQQAMVDVTQVAGHLNSVSAKIDNGSGTVGALVNDKAIYNSLNDTASTARGAVSEAQVGITDFQENMEALKHNFLLKGYFKNRGYEDASDLGKDEIESVPQSSTLKDFTFQAKQLFDKQDSAKLKGQKNLNSAGEFLANNDFGLAVIEISTGKSGSTDAEKTLAEGRALVLRDYLVQHFGFDDTKLKSVSLGKQTDEVSKDDWGLVKILIYPPGTPVPPDKSPDKSTDKSPAANTAVPEGAASPAAAAPSN